MSKAIRYPMLFLLLFLNVIYAETLVEMNDFYVEEVKVAGFTLNSAQEVAIEANAIIPRKYSRHSVFSNAWILNSTTREVIWELREAEESDRQGFILKFDLKLQLNAGTYEAYYSTFPDYESHKGWFWSDNGGFFSSLFDYDKDYYFDEEITELYILIRGEGTPLSYDQLKSKQAELKANSFISFSGLRDEVLHEEVFKVNQATEVRIYALGEARRDGEYDFGWIVDLNSRERVWQLSYRSSDHAGGADKNRLVNGTITLEPGIYKLVYVTDDSHSYRRWNMAPPYDPEFWGITVWLKNASERENLAKADEDEVTNRVALVEFTKVRNREYLSQGFELKEPLELHIYAMGEGDDGDMYDYAWIVDIADRKTVWEMDYYDTDPAGGAEKNRLFDGLISLKKGKYVVYYVTDGSHAYHAWNSGAPFDEKRWGITISVAGNKKNQGVVLDYNEESDPSVLVKMTRMGDYDRRRAKLTLDKDQYISVYALGEGTRGEMYDYAWIEDANTGKTVWEMTYRKTENAGGADKNRVFNDKILLPAGEYYVIYETDDSHSFDDWNESPPYDPANWGITITLAEK